MIRSEKYKLFIDGQDYQNKYIELIKSAESSITIQTYIFEIDTFGREVYEELIRKAKAGISVSILLDYFGSFHFPEKLKEEIENTPNISFLFFNPVRFPKILQIGRRLHQKVLLIDCVTAMIGGINIGESIDPDFPRYPRLDFAILLEGEIIESLDEYCSNILRLVIEKKQLQKTVKTSIPTGQKVSLKINDWFRGRKQITSSYNNLIESSSESILLIHGYFFPSVNILKSLKKKAKEGVKVELVLPEYSDWKSWVWATTYLYYDLTRNNIKVLTWNKSRLHGKFAIFDDKIITLGSHNLNYTSSYGNIELNVEISDESFAKEVRTTYIDNIVKDSHEAQCMEFENLPMTKKLWNTFFSFVLVAVSSVSISFIKIGKRLSKMPWPAFTVMILLFLVGVLGVLFPIIPGIPFIMAAVFIYMKSDHGDS